MNILVLGGSTKLGGYLTRDLLKRGHLTLNVGREMADFKSGWMLKIEEPIKVHFGDPRNINIVIVNVYDHDSGYQDVQEEVFKSMFDFYRDQNTTIVVMGSMIAAHAVYQTTYAKAKRSLANAVIRASTLKRACKLVLIEPGVLENNVGAYPNSPYATFEEVAEIIRYSFYSSASFLRLGLVGRHFNLENNNAQSDREGLRGSSTEGQQALSGAGDSGR